MSYHYSKLKFITFHIQVKHGVSINPILIRVYPCKRGWSDLNLSSSNLSNSHSPSRSIHSILHLRSTCTLALLLHLYLPRLLWSSSPPLALHFKLQHFSQNTPVIPPQHMPIIPPQPMPINPPQPMSVPDKNAEIAQMFHLMHTRQ